MSLLVASIAGTAGAVCRYLVSGWVQRRSMSGFPAGTLIVNVLGAFGLGLVVGAGSVESMTTIVFAGFFGGFTTGWSRLSGSVWPADRRWSTSQPVSSSGSSPSPSGMRWSVETVEN